jgi:hypothetical protein
MVRQQRFIANGVADLHYVLASAPNGTTTGGPYATTTGVFPIPPWSANSATSKWISPRSSYAGMLSDPAGEFTYTTTFDLTGF